VPPGTDSHSTGIFLEGFLFACFPATYIFYPLLFFLPSLFHIVTQVGRVCRKWIWDAGFSKTSADEKARHAWLCWYFVVTMPLLRSSLGGNESLLMRFPTLDVFFLQWRFVLEASNGLMSPMPFPFASLGYGLWKLCLSVFLNFVCVAAVPCVTNLRHG